ncbi:hypothetical protein BDY24DRAFT_385424 [Mrakia frigida]|uniref:uncharacterized protein n=1 Tax=Mrakia frigida TaxID=29902 RepID=UPI003FCC05CF
MAAATLNRQVEHELGSSSRGEGAGSGGVGAERRGGEVSWDEEVVPTLRKRLESEAAFLSKRLSNPKPISIPPSNSSLNSHSSPSDYQAHQWHRPTPQHHSYRSSEDYNHTPPPNAPPPPLSVSPISRSPTAVSKIPIPSRARRKDGEDVFFPRSEEEELGGRFIGDSSSGGEVGTEGGSPTSTRDGPRSRTKSTPLAFSKQPVQANSSSQPWTSDSYAISPAPPIADVSPSERHLDLPPNRSNKSRTPSPTDHFLANASSGSNTSSPSLSPKQRTVALPYPPTRIPAPAPRSRSGSTSSNNKLLFASNSSPPSQPLPRSTSHASSLYPDGSPVLMDDDDPWSETEVIRSDRMIRDEVAPFRILSPELVVPGAGGRLELGKVDTFTERELFRQTGSGAGRREMLEIAMKGHSPSSGGGGGVEEFGTNGNQGSTSGSNNNNTPSPPGPNGVSEGRRRVTSTAALHGRSNSSSSSARNTPNGRQPIKTTTPQSRKSSSPGPIASLEPPKIQPRTPRTSAVTRPAPGSRKASTGPRSLPKSQSDNVRAPTPEDDEFGGYRMSMFGPDSVPPTSSERGQALNWDDNILPTVRKKQKAPNPLDKWEEMGPVQGSPLQGKSDRWTNGTELPRLANGRPVQNGEGEEYGEVGDGSGNYSGKRGDEEEEAPPAPGTFGYDASKRKPPPTDNSNSPRPTPLNLANSNSQLAPPRSNNGGPTSPAPFQNAHYLPNSQNRSPYLQNNANGNGRGGAPIVQQPGQMRKVDPLYPATPPMSGSSAQDAQEKKEKKSGGCCACSIM